MALSIAERASIIDQFSHHPQDTGSVEVQVAVLTKDINGLNDHIKRNRKDIHCRLGLVAKVRRRESLLNYLYKKNVKRYLSLVQALSLRDKRKK